jgi:hypothetical protein
MVSSPRSQLRRKTWYTALAVASALLLFLPQTPRARALPADDTPPVVTYSITGIVGAHDWYRGSSGGNYIVVHWSVSDPEGGIIETIGCEPAIQIPGPNTGTRRTCSATSGGGTTTITTKLLKIDATPPITSASPSRSPNGAGWYRAPLSISWRGTDATSGIDSCRAPLAYSGPDTTGSSKSGSCTDLAGNSSSDSFLLKYDHVAPSTVATPSRAPNAAGWYRAPLSIGWHASDLTSGVASCSSSRTYGGPDTMGTSESGSCTDIAGNSSSTAVVIRFDATAPVTWAVPSRRPDANGWYNHPLAVRWSGSDAPAGIASCTSLAYGGPDTAGAVLAGRCTDRAGNTSGSLGFALKYDGTPPAFKALALKALDGVVKLKWRLSGATQLRISRSSRLGKSAARAVYEGVGTAFTDRRVENYVRYRYTLTAIDPAGNTVQRTAVATPLPILFAPRPGARLGRHAAPFFAWRPVPKARYYNLQLWRNGRQVGSWWPSRARLRLPSRWRYKGGSHRLERGRYAWYVWPGRGPRRLARYGPLLGTSTFVVR